MWTLSAVGRQLTGCGSLVRSPPGRADFAYEARQQRVVKREISTAREGWVRKFQQVRGTNRAGGVKGQQTVVI